MLGGHTEWLRLWKTSCQLLSSLHSQEEKNTCLRDCGTQLSDSIEGMVTIP